MTTILQILEKKPRWLIGLLAWPIFSIRSRKFDKQFLMLRFSYIAGNTIFNTHIFCNSAGCGRTGTLIAMAQIVETIDYFIEQRSKAEITVEQPEPYYIDADGANKERVSIFGIVRRLRE